MKTAKEFLQEKGYFNQELYNNQGESEGLHISNLMILFAKYHVELALSKVCKEATTNCHCVEGYCDGVDKQSILEAYSIEDIK